MEQAKNMSSLRELKENVKSRIRARFRSFLQLDRPLVGAETMDTSRRFAVARVFSGNVVLARITARISRNLENRLRNPKSVQFNGGNPFLGEIEHRKSISDDAGRRTDQTITERKPNSTAHQESSFSETAQAIMLPIVAHTCHAFMHKLNNTEIYGSEKLLDAIQNRAKGRGLVTVSNHVAAMDDPLVLSAMVPPPLLFQADQMRWTLCATDRCFTNPAMSSFFRSVKVLPVRRGEGVDQVGMDLAVAKVRNGDWVHIFPEGSRSRDGGRTLGPIKRGIGRLVSETDVAPIILPFIHTGMERVLSIGSKFPSTGNKIHVLVGDPVDIQDIIDEHRRNNSSRSELYDAIATRVGQKMANLKVELELRLDDSRILSASSGSVPEVIVQPGGSMSVPSKESSTEWYMRRLKTQWEKHENRLLVGFAASLLFQNKI